MFKNYNAETFDEQALLKDPLYQKCVSFHKAAIDFTDKKMAKEATIAYLKGLAIQTVIPSIISDEHYGPEYKWFDVNIYEHLFGYLDVYRLANVCKVSRAWNYYASSPNLWKRAYAKYFNIHSSDHGSIYFHIGY